MYVLRTCLLFAYCVGLLYGALLRHNKLNTLKTWKKPLTKGLACKQRVSGFRAHNIKINEGCKKGEIRWSLTKEYLNLSFQVKQTKELCFSSRAPSGLEKYTVFRKVGKTLQKLGTPRRGVDVCFTIKQGQTSFRINPTGLYYGLYVRYTLIGK